MARCKQCGRSQWFGTRKFNGLCRTCEPKIRKNINAREQKIKRSFVVLRASRDREEMISNCEVILEHATALRTYEDMGIPTTQPPPSILIRSVQEKRKGLLSQATGNRQWSDDEPCRLRALRADALRRESFPEHGLARR